MRGNQRGHMTVQSSCGNRIHVRGCLTRTHIRRGGVWRIRFCGCTGSVRCSSPFNVFATNVVIFAAGAGKSVLAYVCVSSLVAILTLLQRFRDREPQG